MIVIRDNNIDDNGTINNIYKNDNLNSNNI